MLYVVSDLHLDERGNARMFADDRQGRELAALCERVARDDDAELVLLGDTFDFTSMQPPERGLERFFQRLDVPHEPPRKRALPELLDAIRESNPLGFEALCALSKKAKVTIVPGNHDWLLGEPGAQAELQRHGLQVRLDKSVERRVGDKRIVLQHGHEQDPGNRDPGGRGEAMTNALHQAVIPFLLHHGARRNVKMDVSRVVLLRPEEAVISVLQRWLDERTFRRFFRAFLNLLAQNRYVPRPVTFLARLVSVNRVRAAVAKADVLWEHTGSFAVELLQGKRKLPHGAAPPDVLVFGHTHVLDWAAEGPKLYVNLGTWTERALDASSPPDGTLPLLTFSAPGGQFRASLSDLNDRDRELQRFDTVAG